MRGWAGLLINELLREIGGKSCLSLRYADVNKYANRWTSERNSLQALLESELCGVVRFAN